MALERIIITFEKSGEFRGASATDYDGLPTHLDQSALTAIIPELNAAAMAKLETIEATHAADLAAATAERDALRALKAEMEAKVMAALQSGDPEQFAALGVEFITPEQQKLKAEKLALIAQLQAEVEKL